MILGCRGRNVFLAELLLIVRCMETGNSLVFMGYNYNYLSIVQENVILEQFFIFTLGLLHPFWALPHVSTMVRNVADNGAGLH